MIIYKITNLINKKIYIGQTIGLMKKRWYKHCSEAKNNKSMPIARAIVKYKKENFIIEEIDSASTKDELNVKEIYWIDYYQSYKKEYGYNISLGGKNINLSPEAEAKRIANMIKPVYQYDLCGNFIKKWDKVRDAVLNYNDTGQVIAKCARQHGYSKTAKGFQWNYNYVDKMPNVQNVGRVGKKNNQPKILMKEKTKVIKKFDSIQEAAQYIFENNSIRTTNVKSIVDGIYRYLYQKKKISHAYGFQWEYLF
jgi:group I intron endonuclease